jgi:pullulanase
MMRKFIIDSLVFWVEEYKIDGFRFDLMGIHDIVTMKEVESVLRKVKPDILLYGEGWTGGNSPLSEDLRLVKRNISQVPGIGVFNDDIRDGIKGHVFFNDKGGFVSGKGQRESVKFGIVGATNHPQVNYRKILYTDFPWAQNPGQSINYVSAHDNLTLYDKLEAANKDASREALKEMAKLANTIVLTSQGVPFLHAGVEFLRTKCGDHNSYRSSDSVNALNWSQKSRNIDVVQYYKGLIALRKEYPVFRLRTQEDIEKYLSFYGPEDRNIISYTLKDPNGFYTLLLAFNGGDRSFKLRIPTANWDVLLDKDEAGILPLWSTREPFINIKPYSAMILMTRDKI